MPLLTNEVSTVPGTVAAYQPLVSKPSVATMSASCGILDTSCSCQPEESVTGRGSVAWALPCAEMSVNDIDTRIEHRMVLIRLCKVGPSLVRFRLPVEADAMNSNIVAGEIRVSPVVVGIDEVWSPALKVRAGTFQ